MSEIEHTEVSFNNGDLQLAGMLIVPDGEGPFPVAVIIHGSGTSRRSNRWYLAVAKRLEDSGIAVLLPDKRGSEKSDGDWRTSSLEDLAGDTIGAIEFVKGQEQFDVSYIGVVGMSQGVDKTKVIPQRHFDIAFPVTIGCAAQVCAAIGINIGCVW